MAECHINSTVKINQTKVLALKFGQTFVSLKLDCKWSRLTTGHKLITPVNLHSTKIEAT